MALDPSIILAGRPAQIEPPLNALSRVLSVQQAQNQNELFRRQADAEQRRQDDDNRLRALLAEGDTDPAALADKLTRGGFLPQAQSVTKTAAENAKTQREADAAKFKLHVDKFNHGIQLLGNVQTPEQAQQWLGWQVQNGLMPMQAAQQQQIPTDPAAFAQWREGMQRTGLTAAQHFRDQLDRLQFGETQRHNQATEGATIRGQDLVNARGLEANRLKAEEIAAGGKPPPGYVWEAPGKLKAIPGGPGDKLPESQQKQVVGTQNLSNAIAEYRAELANWGGADALKPDKRALMGTKYNNMMLQAKEAYNLGVLNGPDFMILQSVITDPRSLTGAVTSNKALDRQAQELDRIMGVIGKVSGNKRPQDGAPAPSVPQAPGQPTIEDIVKKYLPKQ